jgi:hypothetical protein
VWRQRTENSIEERRSIERRFSFSKNPAPGGAEDSIQPNKIHGSIMRTAQTVIEMIYSRTTTAQSTKQNRAILFFDKAQEKASVYNITHIFFKLNNCLNQ